MAKYTLLNNLGEGAYAKVFKCEKITDGSVWACKQLVKSYKDINEIHTISEIQVLRQVNKHANIVELHEIIFNKQQGSLWLIFELMDMDLYIYIKDLTSSLPENIVCRCIYSILRALEYIHRHGLIHRDVKPENVLIKGEQVKLADFGMCRSISSERPLTDYVATRWYRAPECILTKGHYGQVMDIWSVGCVMFEIITLKPLFAGESELSIINKIHKTLGTPSTKILEKFEEHRNETIDLKFPIERGTGFLHHLTVCSLDAVDLLIQMLVYDSENRISASNALTHPYFDQISNRTVEVTIENVLSINNIPITEINENDPSVSNLAQVKTDFSADVFWEQLSADVPYYFNLIERLLILAHQIDLCQKVNFLYIKSLSCQIRQTFLFIQNNMKKIRVNLELILMDIRTTLKILVEAPTWKLTIQLLKKALHNLKKNGENCFIFMNELQSKCEHFKKQINKIIHIRTNQSLVAHGKSTESLLRHLTQVISSFLGTIAGSMFDINRITIWNNNIISLIHEKSTKKNLIDRSLLNSYCNDTNGHIEETLQLPILLGQQWDNVVSVISIVKFKFKLLLDTQINTLIEQVQITDDNITIISEQDFFIKLMKIQLTHLYKKYCSFIIIIRVYLDLLNNFIIGKFDEFPLLHPLEQQEGHCTLTNRCSSKTNTLQIQLTQFLTDEKTKYTMIFQHQQAQLNNFAMD